MGNVVNMVRKTDRVDQEVLDFLKNKKCLIVTWDEESSQIDALSNFDPGLRECTLAHFAYMYLMQQMMEAQDEYEE